MVHIHAAHRTDNSNTKGYLTIQYYEIKNMGSCKSLLHDAHSVIAEIFEAERKQKKKLKRRWRCFWFLTQFYTDE